VHNVCRILQRRLHVPKNPSHSSYFYYSSVEPVEVVDEVSGDVSIHPNLSSRSVDVNMSYINKGIGLSLKPSEMIEVLGKMGLEAKPASNETLSVSVPCTRSDILHPCDIMEDVAIGYGYDNLEKKMPDTYTEGKPFILNKVSDLIRQELAMCGYTEVLTFALVLFFAFVKH
jgi:phenylalanyl-tRNA synthetase beta chain